MIKAWIFDLDNTLYNEINYFLEIFKIFSNNYRINFELFKNNFSEEFRFNSKDIFTDILKTLNIYSSQKQEELFNLYRTADVKLELYEDAKKIIEFAKNNNLKLGLITNGVLEAQKNKVKCLKIENMVDSIVYAREFGKDFEKPHTKAFEKLLRELEMDVTNALFIGDNPYTDLVGAKSAGLKTVFLKRGYFRDIKYEADYGIDDLNDLRNIIVEFS